MDLGSQDMIGLVGRVVMNDHVSRVQVFLHFRIRRLIEYLPDSFKNMLISKYVYFYYGPLICICAVVSDHLLLLYPTLFDRVCLFLF